MGRKKHCSINKHNNIFKMKNDGLYRELENTIHC